MKIILVAAVAADGGIGRANQLLFSDPADQRHLRAVTWGKAVLMGRRTWESLPARFRPLPGRRNVVLTRDAGYDAPGAEVVPSLPAALQRLADAPEVCVLGGGEIYAQALPLADELILTEIGRRFEDADAFFPPVDRAQFEEVQRQPAVAADGTPIAFVTWRRRRAVG